MKRILASLALIVLVSGCDGPIIDHTATQASINSPVYVGTFPDGRKLYQVTVSRGSSYHEHYVYYFAPNDGTTVSVNYEIPQGKTSVNQTIVIDGVTYQAVNTNK